MSIVRFDFGHIFGHVPKTGGTSMEEREFVGGRGHSKISVLFNECRAAGQNPKTLFSWAFVRHPVDRLESAYYALKQHHQVGKHPPLAPTFTKFVEEFSVHPEWKAQHIVFVPMTCWIDEEISFVGRFEHIKRDWGIVCRQITGFIHPLPRLNTTNRPRNPCSPEVFKMVFDLYQEDFKTYYPDG